MIYRFDTLASTSSGLAADADRLGHRDVYVTDNQSAGRGQRGNSWEAEPGRNLTFSILLKPRTVVASKAFAVSMVTALSIADVVAEHIGMEVSIKWPNDIYVGDRKICGILIENTFTGMNVDRSIVGVGINVNQRQYVSDAPNPVSMTMLTGGEYDLDTMLAEVTDRIIKDFEAYENAPDIAALTSRYRSRQWRGRGVWPWRDNLRGEVVEAAIESIAPDGMLTLATEPPRTFAFKEVSAVL